MTGSTDSGTRGTLVLGWGNPGRLDDGLGPALAAAVRTAAPADVAVATDYQLQVEDAAEVARYERVLFVDADRTGAEPYSVRRLEPSDSRMSFSTHSVAPEAVLALSRDLFGAEPEAWLLGIRGYDFDEFGEWLSPRARENLDAAVGFVREACAAGRPFDAAPAKGDSHSEEDSCTTTSD